MPCSDLEKSSSGWKTVKTGIPFCLLAALLLLCCSCTDYERTGVNSRPFNEPTNWENNPYGNVFRN